MIDANIKTVMAGGVDDREDGKLSVRFWGVRGSIPCPGKEYQRYGGNTSCLEVRCGDTLLIFDGGTGLRKLGLELMKDKPANGGLEGYIFLTHTHVDHIAGIPFFAPFFCNQSHWKISAGHLLPERTLEDVLCQFMADPIFPVPPTVFNANLEFLDFKVGEELGPFGEVTIKTAPLNHPNGATGYRIECCDSAICYVTDTEHEVGALDKNVLSLIEGADLLIYDCSYTDEEFAGYVGWGHSTWQEGVRLARAANVPRLAIFHHDPCHDDDKMDSIAKAAAREFGGATVAREGDFIAIG